MSVHLSRSPSPSLLLLFPLQAAIAEGGRIESFDPTVHAANIVLARDNLLQSLAAVGAPLAALGSQQFAFRIEADETVTATLQALGKTVFEVRGGRVDTS